MTKLLIGMVIVTYFARFNKSGKTTLFPNLHNYESRHFGELDFFISTII